MMTEIGGITKMRVVQGVRNDGKIVSEHWCRCYRIEGNESGDVAWMRIGRDVAGMRMGLVVVGWGWFWCRMKTGVVPGWGWGWREIRACCRMRMVVARDEDGVVFNERMRVV
jgi:hypothetical protein